MVPAKPEYVVVIQKLTEQFEVGLEGALTDRLVCGMNEKTSVSKGG